MFDKIGDIASLLVIGAVAIRIVTNKNSASTLGAVFHGFAEDIHAATSAK